MENEVKCPKCGGECKLVPAGVSKKTGKHYDAFYACKTWGCGGTVKVSTGEPKTQSASNSGFSGQPMQYTPQPKKEFKTSMDYKATQIAKAQDSKEESMRLFAAGRDAVLMMTSGLYVMTDEEKQKKILEWRNWFYQHVYHMDESEYKNLNTPF